MIQRCTNPNAYKYPSYGAKGITVCDEWRASFSQFLADMGERPQGTSLDRIDGTKGYFAGNCRWATPAIQMDNLKTTIWVVYKGEKITLTELSRRTGVKKETLKYRIRNGWPDDKISEPANYRKRSIASGV